MKVLPAGTIVVTGFFKWRRYFRVHDYGLVEISAPTPLVKE